ncbi:MAG: hypothetical protein NZT61_00225 [Deltaproteobacteria bacterium]|nr:hypothetical protein [Deltaproteobacteria bacterium]
MRVDRYWLEDVTLSDIFRSQSDLMLGILLNALYDLQLKGREKRLAIDYFLSKEEDWPFSFRFICKHLGINRQAFLEKLGISEDESKLNRRLLKKLPKSILPLKAGCE